MLEGGSVMAAHQKAYAWALSEYGDPVAVEQAFCAVDSWKEALGILGFEPADWEGEIPEDSE